MPYTIHTAAAHIRDNLGHMRNIDVFSDSVESTKEEALIEIENKKTEALEAIGIDNDTEGARKNALKAITDATTAAKNSITAEGKRIEKINNNQATLDTETANMIAEYFDENKNYPAGAYVRQTSTQGSGTNATSSIKLFKFTTNHAAGGWIGTDAIQVNLSEEVADLKSTLIYNVLSSPDIWQNKTISSSGGDDGANSSTRLGTMSYIDRAIKAIKVDNGYQFAIYVYNASDVYQGILQNDLTFAPIANWKNGKFNFSCITGNYQYRLLIRKSTNTAITPATNAQNVQFVYVTDTMLEKSGVPADAKATGDAISEVSGDVSELSSDLETVSGNLETVSGNVNVIEKTIIKTTRNLFNKDHPNLINASFTSSGSTISGSIKTRILYIPCKPNTAYVVMRKTGYYRFNVCTTEIVPASGVSYTYVAPTGVTVDGYEYRLFQTGNDSNYIAVYYYHSDYDSESDLLGYLGSIMIYEGIEYLKYRPYATGYVGANENRLFSTYGIFGVKFMRNAKNPTVMRTYDADGLMYRQQIGETIARSDFDHVFPWCEMRECNVSVNENGNKTVIYAGETGFSRSNDTFIEVPAFWFKRTVVSGVEEWAVSGRPFSGADIEPWFVNGNGTVEKYRYIAKYEGAPTSTDHVSVTGVIPDTAQGLTAYKNYCEGLNYSVMSVQAHLALTHLMVIETAALDVQLINQGISYYPFSSSDATWNKPTNTGVTGNTALLPYRAEMANVLPGDTIYLSDTGAQDTSDPRTVTAITVTSGEFVSITFDGDAYAFTSSTCVFPAKQKTGKADGLTYGSGRLNTGIHGAFAYRGIENLYGNVWELASGITWNYTTGKFSVGNAETSFTAPYQTATGSDSATKGWIKTLGYDRNIPWCTLPETVGGAINKYISDEWNTIGGTGDGQIFAVSGGWDHQSENGMFNVRTLAASGGKNWLYGYRAMV